MINESLGNAHKTFLSLLPEEQRKHCPNWSTLPTYSSAAATTTSPAPNSGVQSNAFPKALKSGFVPAPAIHCTMNLQPHGSFAEVINTFRESSVSSLHSGDRETILPSPILVFCVWVFWLVVLMGCFSSLSFWPLKFCVKLHLAKGNRRGGQEGGIAMPELGQYVQFHSSAS